MIIKDEFVINAVLVEFSDDIYGPILRYIKNNDTESLVLHYSRIYLDSFNRRSGRWRIGAYFLFEFCEEPKASEEVMAFLKRNYPEVFL